MDAERFALFAGVGLAVAVGVFVLWGPSPKPRRRGQVTGIHNLGHTCFMNSLLQALAACPTFTTWLKLQKDKNSHAQFTETLQSVLSKINGFTDDLYGHVIPIEIISSLGSLWNFTPGHQDVHELFHIVLSALQNEALPSNKKNCLSDALPALSTPALIPLNDEGAGDAVNLRSVSCNDLAAAAKHNQFQISNGGLDKNYNNHIASSTHSIRNLSSSKPGIILTRSLEVPINLINDAEKPWNSLHTITPSRPQDSHPFSGLLTSQLQCTNCNWKSSVRYDRLESVFLPLPPNGGSFGWRGSSLSELFSRFVASELVNDVLCEGCTTRCPAMKTLTLGKSPKCLCLHIPRTNWSSSGTLIKRDDHVSFPEYFIIDPFTFNETKKRNSDTKVRSMFCSNDNFSEQSINLGGKRRYKLRAVIEHRGSDGDSGHFVCYRRGNIPGQWFFTSDTTVEKTCLSYVLSANPYLIFYERDNKSTE